MSLPTQEYISPTFFKSLLYDLFFLHHDVSCRILVLRPGIKPEPLAVEVRSLNRWSSREVPLHNFYEEQ